MEKSETPGLPQIPEIYTDDEAFRSIYSRAPLGVVLISSEGRFLNSNPAFEKFVGYSGLELKSLRFLDITFKDDVESSESVFRDMNETIREDYTGEKRYVRKDGQSVWARYSSIPIRDQEGRVVRALTMINDITLLKNAVEEATDLLSLLETTIEATHEGLLVTDIHGDIAITNSRFDEIWKFPADLASRQDQSELREFAVEQLVDPDAFFKTIREVNASPGVESSDTLELKDGRTIIRAVRPRKAKGKVSGFVWSFLDTTLQKKTVKRAEILAEVSRILAASLDYEATLLTISKIIVPKFADWSAIGLAESEAGMRLVTFVSKRPDDAVSARIISTILDPDAPRGIPNVIRTGKAVLYPEVIEKDLYYEAGNWPIVGTRDPVTLATVRKLGLCSFMIVPFKVRGKVIGAMSIASATPDRKFDESDLRLAEELGDRCAIALDSALLYRDALRTIQVREDFLSVASHELRTPLTPLRMQFEMASRFANDLPEDYAERGDLIKLLGGAGLQLDRLLKLVDHLLDVSRIAAGRLSLDLEWFDLGILMGEISARFDPLCKKAGCELKLDFPKELFGFWDRSRMDQVVSNLISNALKFGAGSPIEILVKVIDGEVRVSVRDYGIGIAPDDIERVFERFERATNPGEYHGFGLGLFICRQIITAHAGRISVESEPGKGACFTIQLPERAKP